MSEQKLMKSGLSSSAVNRIAAALSKIIADFPSEQFCQQALSGIQSLELKQRVEHIIGVLADYLPNDFEQAAVILLQIKKHWDGGDEADPLRSFAAWPITDYVAVYGLDHPKLALLVLKDLSPLFSAEFAIRPFIEQHFELTHQSALNWCNDDDEHIRRLASEGFRPRLPWGKRLHSFCDEPAPVLTILQKLRDDGSDYVRKSVANNLNDISKDHPDRVIKLCRQWQYGASDKRRWIIRHGLRSLIKQGNEDVFPLLGYTATPQLNISQFSLNESMIVLGENIRIDATVCSTSTDNQQLIIDYKIHHIKKNGSMTSKVFKWKNINLNAYQSLSLSKSHPFKLITTRRYYPGMHRIELLVNGKSYAEAEFDLKL